MYTLFSCPMDNYERTRKFLIISESNRFRESIRFYFLFQFVILLKFCLIIISWGNQDIDNCYWQCKYQMRGLIMNEISFIHCISLNIIKIIHFFFDSYSKLILQYLHLSRQSINIIKLMIIMNNSQLDLFDCIQPCPVVDRIQEGRLFCKIV